MKIAGCEYCPAIATTYLKLEGPDAQGKWIVWGANVCRTCEKRIMDKMPPMIDGRDEKNYGITIAL